MPASAVSSPTASTRTLSAESIDTVPATTWSPVRRFTGRDSPVIIDSSRVASPSTMSPSAGTRAPGRTSTTSPFLSSATRMRSSPSPVTRSASSGAARRAASRAPDAWPMARISSQCPSNMTTINAASSHQKSRSPTPKVAAHDAANATLIATAISSIMPGLRSRISYTAPVKNGRPPTMKITVPSTGAIASAPRNVSS